MCKRKNHTLHYVDYVICLVHKHIVMDINTIILFPEAFLKKVTNDELLGTYFVGINSSRYSHMMSGIVHMLLSDTTIDIDKIHHIYDTHQHLKTTRADFHRFIKLFEETLVEIGATSDEIGKVIKRLRDIVVMLQGFRANKYSHAIAHVAHKLETTEDLNLIRKELVADVRALEDAIPMSGPLFTHTSWPKESWMDFLNLENV